MCWRVDSSFHPGNGNKDAEGGRRGARRTPAGKAGTAKSRLIITYVVEKGKPLASPA
jgi:hypothetical protein